MIFEREKVLSQILPYKDALDKRNAEGIEKYRKGNFTLHFSGPVGNVRIRQKKHQFLFGSTAFMLGSFEKEGKQEIYEEKFVNLFNQAVVPLYWKDLEPTEGNLRFGKDSENIYRRPPVDTCLEFCEKYGIEPKGHCLAWNWSLPSWLEKYDPNERKKLLERRFKQISEKYADKIPSFDVVNESATNYNRGRKTLFEHYDEYALEWGGKYFKNNRKIINETNDAIWRDYAAEGKYCAFNAQLKELFAKKMPIDEIGLQYHIFVPEKALENGNEVFLNAENMVDVLELFNSYGLPMHISEITIPSFAGKIKENEELQAELIEILYSTWFATEQMKSIVWWNLVDGYAAYAPLGSEEGENYYCGGLLHFDMTEKPAYKTLDRLINKEWKTVLDAPVGGNEFSFRGFYGEYEIEADGKTFVVSLDEDGKKAVL